MSDFLDLYNLLDKTDSTFKENHRRWCPAGPVGRPDFSLPGRRAGRADCDDGHGHAQTGLHRRCDRTSRSVAEIPADQLGGACFRRHFSCH